MRLTPEQINDIAIEAGACDTDMLECAKRAVTITLELGHRFRWADNAVFAPMELDFNLKPIKS